MVTTRNENDSNKKNHLHLMIEEQEIEINGQWRAIEADPTLLSRWLVLEDH